MKRFGNRSGERRKLSLRRPLVEPLAIARRFIAQWFRRHDRWMRENAGKTKGNSVPGANCRLAADYIRSKWKAAREISDDSGKLREVHHKYPVDLGHQPAKGDET